jgi:type III secretion apparatus needle protein
MAGSTNNGSADFVPTLDGGTNHNGTITTPGWQYGYKNVDGMDMVWHQQMLQGQMQKIEVDIRAIQQNANLSDTEKMFSMQMAINAWSAISNLRTNMLKTVSDTLKQITRNVA